MSAQHVPESRPIPILQAQGFKSLLAGTNEAPFNIGFVSALSMQVGGTPKSDPIAADFNGDGKLDVAVGVQSRDSNSNYLFSTIGTVLGRGDGTFEPVA